MATLAEALALPTPPDALLIGIAPTGGKLPDSLAAGHPRGDRGRARRAVRAPHVHRRRPGIRRGGGGTRDDDHRLPTAAGPDGDVDRPAARPGQAGDPDRRERLRDRQDVGRARASAGRAGRRRPGRLRADRPDRDDDRGLGRGRGPADQRLRPGHHRVAGRGGRAARRLGHRRGPGLARPPGLLVGDAGAHPRIDAAGDGDGPQAGTRRTRLRPPARGVVPDRVAARVHRAPRAGRRARRAIEGRRGRAQHLALSRRRRGAQDHRAGRGARRVCPRTTRSASGPIACGRRSGPGWTRCPGSRADESPHHPGGPPPRAARPVPDRSRGPCQRARA